MTILNACAQPVNSANSISPVWACGSAPCSNDDAAVIGKVGLRVALALIKTDGPAGSVVDTAGAVGLVLNRFVHVDVRCPAVESMGRLSTIHSTA